MMFVGGQADLDERGNVNNAGDLRRQTETVLDHLARVLETLEGRLGDLVKINLFHAAARREEEDGLLRQVRKRLPPYVAPVISLVALPRLAYPGMAVMLDAVAIDNADGKAPRSGFNPEGHWPWPRGGAFSQGVRCGELMWVAAQSARGADGSIRHHDDIAAQAQATIDNIGRVLAAMGADLD